MDGLKKQVEDCTKLLSSSDSSQVLEGSKQFYDLIIKVWSLDTSLAKDAAELVSDTIRESGGLDRMLTLLHNDNSDVRLEVSKGLEQVMTQANRHFIAGHKEFDAVAKVACCQSCQEGVRCGMGILENLFKDSQETCLRLIHSGGLDCVLKGCRNADRTILQHCAAALANCSMYGGSKCQMSMVSRQADHWLFPLAFSQDIVVKYYALLAICFIASNPKLADEVTNSGTLDLVLPFIKSQDPEQFPKTCFNHTHGRSAEWLKRLVPLLTCGNEQARSLSAFHFAMEATVKKKQNRLQVFSEIGAISRLQESAKKGSQLTAGLCCQALITCGAALPDYLCWDALNWTPSNVAAWVKDISLEEFAPAFIQHLVTGSLLVDLTLEDLKELGFSSRLQGRRFLLEVEKLRCLIDVSEEDQDHVGKWLTGVCKNLNKYKVDFIRGGVKKSLLPHLTDNLLQELGISKSLDRLKLLLAVEELPQASEDIPDSGLVHHQLSPHKAKYDIFISYRRTNGSQLASLLKVHLHLRGLSVFLDVEELGSGKFDEAILSTIRQSSNILLVLSDGALDRCVGDASMQDWVHREIACALEHKVHVIPILGTEFQWPKQSDLPEDLQQVCTLNGVSWSHEYQDACVEKIISFLHMPRASRRRTRGVSLGLHEPTTPSTSNH